MGTTFLPFGCPLSIVPIGFFVGEEAIMVSVPLNISLSILVFSWPCYWVDSPPTMFHRFLFSNAKLSMMRVLVGC